jgi:hypothetical protein
LHAVTATHFEAEKRLRRSLALLALATAEKRAFLSIESGYRWSAATSAAASAGSQPSTGGAAGPPPDAGRTAAARPLARRVGAPPLSCVVWAAFAAE